MHVTRFIVSSFYLLVLMFNILIYEMYRQSYNYVLVYLEKMLVILMAPYCYDWLFILALGFIVLMVYSLSILYEVPRCYSWRHFNLFFMLFFMPVNDSTFSNQLIQYTRAFYYHWEQRFVDQSTALILVCDDS